MVRSRRDGGYLAAISPRFRISQTSWRDLYNLGEMENISPQSRQDLESYKHHGEISVRSLQSRRDLGKNFARVVTRILASWTDIRGIGFLVISFYANEKSMHISG